MFKFRFSPATSDPDVNRTIMTSQQLNIAEFELFGLAWREWYGTPAVETDLERHFLVYVFDGRVPFWVRKFCLDMINHPDRCERFARPHPHEPGTTQWDTNSHNNVLIA